jgi:hypothetical protein
LNYYINLLFFICFLFISLFLDLQYLKILLQNILFQEREVKLISSKIDFQNSNIKEDFFQKLENLMNLPEIQNTSSLKKLEQIKQSKKKKIVYF